MASRSAIDHVIIGDLACHRGTGGASVMAGCEDRVAMSNIGVGCYYQNTVLGWSALLETLPMVG